jgi:hypothetical protein
MITGDLMLCNPPDMITDNDPVINKFISTPRELSSLNTGAFVAGIVEAILDGSNFVSAHHPFVVHSKGLD